MERILIRHLTGARSNQVDEFSALQARELIVGRDQTAHIRFDPDMDDLVSRQHVRIVQDPGAPEAFQLVDLQSRNGTFLNRERVYGAVCLNHNDLVQVGAGGPEFRFEIDPPPVNAARPTREASPETLARLGIKSTRESFPPGPAQSRPVGRATVERMLGDVVLRVKGSSDKSALFAGMALAAILAVGAITWLYLRQSRFEQAAEQDRNLSSLQQIIEESKRNPEIADSMKKEIARLGSRLNQSDQRHQEEITKLITEFNSRIAQDEALKAARAVQSPSGVFPVQTPIPQVQIPGVQPVPQPGATSGDIFQQSYDSLMDKATEKSQHGQAKEALTLVEIAIGKESNRWEGYEFAGQLAGMLEDYGKATSMMQKALQLAPAESREDIQYKLDDLKQKMEKK
jgi:pSer/pThr/pTyr-binding forkhead associated (FHA) protein